MSEILVVSNDGIGLTHVLKVLTAAGYRASGASTFEEAKCSLADRSPDLVIADERLGLYNGLHVIVRARAGHPDVGAIVTTPVKNRALEADAKSLNVECIVKPQNPSDWLEPIWRTLNMDRAGAWSPAQSQALPASGGT